MSNNVKMFHEMGIDDRILEGISSVKWKYPTRVQEMAIPFVLEGKTVIAEARTGSGKSGAFLIPCLHRILLEKNTAATQNVRMLILAPTKELCRQISCMAQQLTTACTREIKVLDLSPNLALEEQKALLHDLPDVVIGPPRRILAHVTQGNLDISEILSVVVDEADLMLAFQHKDALDELWKYLPPLYQSFITSATLGKKMDYIKSFLAVGAESMKELTNNIVILRLKETPLPATSQLNHYVIKLEKFEKAVLLLHIFKNKLLTGKTIIFVNSITMAYRLRMFLGQFAIPTCILNSELPANTRCDIIEQFNSGTFETIIAADGDISSEVMKGVDVDNESGTSRGLDFQFVSNIINFDFPETTVSYIHRVGRTARIGNQGTALNMVSMDQQDSYKKILKELNELMEVSETSKKNYEGIFKKFSFDIKDYDVIRYRAEDPWWSCSNSKILSARKREICQQLLNSKKLEAHFRANPYDRSMLRHEKYQHGIKTQGNLKNLLPSYNMADRPEKEIDEEELPKKKKKKQQKITKGSKKMADKLHKMKQTKNMKKKKRQMKDPLKKLEFSGFKK